MAGGGVEAWAERLGSGGRLGRRRRHAGAGHLAVVGRCRRAGRWLAVALSAPHFGIIGGAGGKRAAQVGLQVAHAQGRQCAQRGPH